MSFATFDHAQTMSSYAQRLATDLRNAYEAHDRDAFERHLQRVLIALEYMGPQPRTNDERLQQTQVGPEDKC